MAGLQAEGITANIIGNIVERGEGLKLKGSSGIRKLPLYEQDELTKILGSEKKLTKSVLASS